MMASSVVRSWKPPAVTGALERNIALTMERGSEVGNLA